MAYGSGKYIFELADGWAKWPPGWSLGMVSGLATDSSDRLYVFQRGGPQPVVVLDRNGQVERTWGEGSFDKPHGIYVSPDGFVFCADYGNHTVSKFTPEGKLLMVLGNKGRPSDSGYERKPGASMESAVETIKRGAPPFNLPTNTMVSRSGHIYVSDGYGNARVHKFSPDGKLLLSWGEPGTGPGQFMLVHRVWLDTQERVWVADRHNSRVQVFSPQGEFIKQWPCFRPTDVFIDRNDIVYLGEGKPNHAVGLYSTEGQPLARLARKADSPVDAPAWTPHTLAVDSRGDIYISGSLGAATGASSPGTVLKLVRQ
ncbi:MAG: hypothetical protein HYY32_04335 [Chloroflexi bacterium]|nr:hypothetical protein [Chloroflexota bacterium]